MVYGVGRLSVWQVGPSRDLKWNGPAWPDCDKNRNFVDDQRRQERDGTMKRLSVASISLVALVGPAVGLWAADGETFIGTAARSGTYKRPLLDVGGKRYELKA